jgi:hypothetical protein
MNFNMSSSERLRIDGRIIDVYRVTRPDPREISASWDDYCTVKSSEMFGMIWSRKSICEIFIWDYAGYWFTELTFHNSDFTDRFKLEDQHFEEFLTYYCGFVSKIDKINWKEEGF